MEFKVASEFEYEVKKPSSLTLNIQPFKVVTESISIWPQNIQYTTQVLADKRILLVSIKEPGIVKINYQATVLPQYRFVNCPVTRAIDITQLPHNVHDFLHPSRYCESDKLEKFASSHFGNHDTVFETVFAIMQWINSNIEYVSGSTNSHTTATEIILQRTGVCRDFAHLGIALCRAMNIPARYCSVYAYQLHPQDFHACFEAYITNEWIVFDATRLAPLNGMTKIASGMDAADTAIANLYGDVIGNAMKVNVTTTSTDFAGNYNLPGSAMAFVV